MNMMWRYRLTVEDGMIKSYGNILGDGADN